MIWASAAVMVDLPSLGRAEVMPTILFEVFVGSKSIASFIERIDSANRDNGLAVAAQYIPELLVSVLWPNSLSPRTAARGESVFCSGSLSRGTSDKQGSCNVASICAVVRKPRSFISLANPRAEPSAIPPNRRNANSNLDFGLLFFCGGAAVEMTRASGIGNEACWREPI